MQISQRYGPERQLDPMERARDNADRAKRLLNDMPDNRTNQMNNNLNGCGLNNRCQQVGNGNINIGGQDGHILKTGRAGINNAQFNRERANQYLHGNINNGRFNISSYQVGNTAYGRGASNSAGQIGGD